VRDEREERLVVLVAAGGHRIITRRRDLNVDRLAPRAGEAA
jgi:hypothetical protein